MTTNQDFANMLQAFLAAQQNVAQEQQNMMREFLREQARTRAEDNDRRASQAPMPPDMSDSDDVDDDGGEYRVKETGRLISKHIIGLCQHRVLHKRVSGDLFFLFFCCCWWWGPVRTRKVCRRQ